MRPKHVVRIDPCRFERVKAELSAVELSGYKVAYIASYRLVALVTPATLE